MSVSRLFSHLLRANRHLATASSASARAPVAQCSSEASPKEKLQKEHVTVTFLTSDGQRYTVQGVTGESLLDVVINKHIPVDGYGACEGTLACSTCHVILDQADFNKLPSKPSDEELDMLDLAYGLSDTSRLGCQVILSKDLEGLTVKLPAGVADARS